METFIEENNLVLFQYEIKDVSEASITFNVYEVLDWLYNEENGGYDVVGDTELYLEAFMKWDGCNHFWFGNEGYMHLCGDGAVKMHQKVMEKCLEISKTKIKRYDCSEAE